MPWPQETSALQTRPCLWCRRRPRLPRQRWSLSAGESLAGAPTSSMVNWLPASNSLLVSFPSPSISIFLEGGFGEECSLEVVDNFVHIREPFCFLEVRRGTCFQFECQQDESILLGKGYVK